MKHILPFLIFISVCACNTFQSPGEQAADAQSLLYSEWLHSVIDSIDTNDDFNGIVLIQYGNRMPVYARKGSRTLEPDGEPLSTDDRFHVASLSKLFTGLATLVLLDAYGMSADEPIGPYLPELGEAVGRVTIRQLANHTNGIHDYLSLTSEHQGLENRDVLKLLSGIDSTVFRPGTRWGYSNSGYVLLAELIERVSGESFEQYISKRIFGRVSLNRDDYLRPEREAYLPGYLGDTLNTVYMQTTGDAGLVLSAKEWLSIYQGDSLFSDYWYEAQKLSGPWNDTTWRYGFGWFFSKDELGAFRAHSGRTEGFQAYLRVNSDRSLFFLILSNKADPVIKALRDGIANGIKEHYPI